MTVRVQPAMSPGHSARVTEAMSLSDSAFCKNTDNEGDELGDEDIEEDESLDVDDERERSNDKVHRLDDKGRGLEGEGLGLEEEEEAAPEGQQQAVLVVDIAASEPLGLGYGAARRRALESIEVIAPSTYEVGQSSRSMPEQQGAYRVFAFRQPTLTTWLDPEDDIVYTDIPIYPPVAPFRHRYLLSGRLDHTQCLDALPPTLIADIDSDVRELYTRSGVVRDEIFSQRYDDHRLIHDMLVQQTAMKHKLQEMRGRVTALKQEKDRRE
ncbi:hypothetical protein Tco_0921652 [Tanacetum coccineum]